MILFFTLPFKLFIGYIMFWYRLTKFCVKCCIFFWLELPLAFMGLVHIFLRMFIEALDRTNVNRSIFGLDPASLKLMFLPTAVAKLIFNELSGEHLKHAQNKDLEEKADSHGYQLETYEVTTDDGYILTVHRIPGDEENGKRNRVAFIMHGLKSSSADWLIGAGFAYAVADRGYDVWMGNFRGNKFAKRHVTKSPDDREFWDFSFDEHGAQDLPAMLTFVRNETGADKIDFFGHSMGTTSFFVMMNVRPEMGSMIGRCVAMAPVADLPYLTGMPYWFVRIADTVCAIMNFLGIYRLDVSKRLPGYTLVATLVIYAMGYHDVDLDDVREILSFSPAGCSTEDLRHFVANYKRGQFRARKKEYLYHLSKLRSRIEIWYSDDDWAACEEDVMDIVRRLPKPLFCKKVDNAKFGHLDYMWSKAAPELYQKILDGPKDLSDVIQS